MQVGLHQDSTVPQTANRRRRGEATKVVKPKFHWNSFLVWPVWRKARISRHPTCTRGSSLTRPTRAIDFLSYSCGKLNGVVARHADILATILAWSREDVGVGVGVVECGLNDRALAPKRSRVQISAGPLPGTTALGDLTRMCLCRQAI